MAIVDRRGNVVSSVDRVPFLDPHPGLAYKTAVKCATTGDVPLSGLDDQDGVAISDGDRILVRSQSDARENGIYEASSTSWTRTRDADGQYDLAPGCQVYVLNGDTQGNLTFYLSSPTSGVITIGTTLISFSRVPLPDSNVQFIFDGNGAILLSGDRIYEEIPFACTVTKWTMLANVVSTMVVDLLMSSYADWPSVTSICGSDLPTLTAAQKNQGSLLTGWTVDLPRGSIITGRVVSNVNVSLCTVVLTVQRK